MQDQTAMIDVPGGKILVRSRLPDAPGARRNTPLIFIHGGPGGSHFLYPKYLPALAEKRPVYYYDQLGSLGSPALFGEDLLSLPRFVAELAAVLDHFGAKRAILLGHSWGACIALDFALAAPERVAGLILSSPLISTPRWIADANRLLEDCPPDVIATIRAHLAAGTIDDPAYKAAESVFYDRHVCRLNPWPDDVIESFKKGNKQIYRAMWGASEFVCSGTLRDYDRFSDLSRLTMPVQLMCGRHDEATPETMDAALRLLPDGRLHVFEKSAHLAYVEETAEYLRCVDDFAESITA